VSTVEVNLRYIKTQIQHNYRSSSTTTETRYGRCECWHNAI